MFNTYINNNDKLINETDIEIERRGHIHVPNN